MAVGCLFVSLNRLNGADAEDVDAELVGLVVAAGCLFVSPNKLNGADAEDVDAEDVGVEFAAGCLLKRLKDGAAGAADFEAELVGVLDAPGGLSKRLKGGAAGAAGLGAEIVDVEVVIGCLLKRPKDGPAFAVVGAVVVFEVPVESSLEAVVKNEEPVDCVAGLLREFWVVEAGNSVAFFISPDCGCCPVVSCDLPALPKIDPPVSCGLLVLPKIDPAVSCGLLVLPKIDPAVSCGLLVLPKIDPAGLLAMPAPNAFKEPAELPVPPATLYACNGPLGAAFFASSDVLLEPKRDLVELAEVVPKRFVPVEFGAGADIELCADDKEANGVATGGVGFAFCDDVKDANGFAVVGVESVVCVELCPEFDGAKRLNPCPLF